MEERRRYYRINDEINLRYQIIDDEQYEHEIHHAKVGYIHQTDLIKAYAYISARIEKLIRKIESSDPVVAETLTLMNRKISSVEMMIESDSVESITSLDEHAVNLSGCGIGFHSENPVLEDTALKLELILLPETYFMSVFGRVISCTEEENGRYFVAVDFEEINDEYQERIVQHVLKKQTRALKNSA